MYIIPYLSSHQILYNLSIYFSTYLPVSLLIYNLSIYVSVYNMCAYVCVYLFIYYIISLNNLHCVLSEIMINVVLQRLLFMRTCDLQIIILEECEDSLIILCKPVDKTCLFSITVSALFYRFLFFFNILF